MAASLVGLKHSGDAAAKMGRPPHQALSNVWACIAVTPWPDFKYLGMHCCYSMARPQMSKHALLLLRSQTSNVRACIAVILQLDFKCPSGRALHLLCSQTHWSPGRYSIHFQGGKLNLTKIDLTFVKALML